MTTRTTTRRKIQYTIIVLFFLNFIYSIFSIKTDQFDRIINLNDVLVGQTIALVLLITLIATTKIRVKSNN